jgi:hypothetical protein
MADHGDATIAKISKITKTIVVLVIFVEVVNCREPFLKGLLRRVTNDQRLSYQSE